MEEFLSSFPRMQPASFDISTDVYEHKSSGTNTDDFDNEKSWFNFAVNVATGMFKNENNNHNNNNNNNINGEHNNVSGKSRRRSHRHQISIWGPSAFREKTHLNDIPEESEHVQNKDTTETTQEKQSKENINQEKGKEPLMGCTTTTTTTTTTNAAGSTTTNMSETSKLKDDISDSLEIPMIDDILRQQPSLALSQQMIENLESSHARMQALQQQEQQMGELKHSRSCPNLLSQHNLSLHDDCASQISNHSYQSHISQASQKTQMSHLSQSLVFESTNSNGHTNNENLNTIKQNDFGYIGTNNSNYNYNKINSVENDIDWSLKQANHRNFSQFLLNDNININNNIDNNNNNVNITDNDYFGCGNETGDEKMNSAEHYHLYSKFKELKLEQSKLKFKNESEIQDDVSVTSASSHVSSHVSSQYGFVHFSKNAVEPQKSGSASSVTSQQSNSANSGFNLLQYNQSDTTSLSNDNKAHCESVQLIASPIPQFSAKFSEKKLDKKTKGKRKSKRKSSRRKEDSPAVQSHNGISDSESNMSSNVSWCVVTDK